MIADVDKDGSGAIDFDEFVHMMTAKMGERDSKEELTKAFQIIDQDKNVNLAASLLSTPNFGCPALGLYINLYCFLFVYREKSQLQTFSGLPRSWVKLLRRGKFTKWLRKQIVTVSIPLNMIYWTSFLPISI